MIETVKLRYLNADLQIGLASLKEAYVLAPEPALLLAEVYRGKLVYRAKGSTQRISYDRLKKGLRKTTKVLTFTVPDWLYAPSLHPSTKRVNVPRERSDRRFDYSP